jgi:3-hydroxyacyl-CoA dehydrogenase
MSTDQAARVEYQRRGKAALLTLASAPVNALSVALRQALLDRLSQALADPTVVAVVVTGAGNAFVAGADIREFGKPAPAGAATTADLARALESATKPVVAAINGVAAGGGLELALGCHARIAGPKARIGLPEVKLGLIPGAGGTQRLPRLIGVEPALELILTGELVTAEKARALGIVDGVESGDLLAAAAAMAERLAAEGKPPRRTSALEDKLAAARAKTDLFASYRKEWSRRARGQEAPQACIEAVELALQYPFEEAMARERAIFDRRVASPQSKALRHVFFAEREVAKVPDIPPSTATLPIRRAGVVGCGTMGGGIAMNFANAGIPVTVLETEPALLDKGLGIVAKNYAATVAKGRLSQAEMEKRLALIQGTTSYDDLEDSDIVVEAVFEDMEAKKKVFEALDRIVKPGAILATNTSTLDVDAIAGFTKRPDHVVGTHFFSPANVMRLMENVRGKKSEPAVVATVMALSKTLGKVGVLSGVCDGFIGNRMLYPYWRQANALLLEGALPQDVDKALYEFGFPMGPFATNDLTGLDISWRVRARQIAEGKGPFPEYAVADGLVAKKRLGQKTGAGFYRYAAGDRTPIPDPEVEELIRDASAAAGLQRRRIEASEIVERCLYPLINEGAKILDEGIAARAGDIDIVWINGYGFPAYRGGPMFFADQIGLGKILGVLENLQERFGTRLKPAPLLVRLAKEGNGFGDV